MGGLELVEDARVGFEDGGVAGAFGVKEALLAAVLVDAEGDNPVDEAFEMAMGGLDGGAEGELTDFLMGEALGVSALTVVDDGLGAVDFTVPVPNVPELIIYESIWVTITVL